MRSMAGGSYDRRAALFDTMVGSSLYNRIAWAASPDEYRSFAAQAVASARGPLVEIAAGSARMTLDLHVAGQRPTLITDLSPGMVDFTRRRAADFDPATTTHLDFAVADAFALSESTAVRHAWTRVETILGLGLLHMVHDPAALVESLRTLCAPGATIHLSGLVAGRPLSSLYLSALARAGEVAVPRTASELSAALGGQHRLECRGAMAYAVIHTD